MVVVRAARGARSEDVRRRNLGTLLRHVHVHGATTRSTLTSLLALNRSTIGDLTAELTAAGLVHERTGPAPAGRPGGGRPSYVVEPEVHRVQVLAVDLGVTHLTVARVGLGGEILARRDRSHQRGPKRVSSVVRTIGRLCRELLAELPAGAACIGAGAAVPGMVRVPDGLVRQVPNLGWSDVPLGAELALELDMAVTVGNDADLGALAEHVRGAAVGCDDVVYLAGHSGIGAGIFVSGHPLAGSRGYAGEVGHVVVNPDGLDCRCGSRGCWETEAGEERLFDLAGRPAGGGLDGVRAVLAAAAEGDRAAANAVRHVATWLGRGAANVVNSFNPEVVILGGALADIYAVASDAVHEAMDTYALAPPREGLRVITPAFGNDSSLVGAAELAFGPLLADPLLEISKLHAS
jgi:predicted NBD/HSP70 family sugar kinase